MASIVLKVAPRPRVPIDSESASGADARGGNVKDEPDCCSTIQDAELTVPDKQRHEGL